MGISTALSNASATGCAGTRNASVSRPARARSQTRETGVLGTTRVSGPGQNASASFIASLLKRPSTRAAASEATCAISGLNAGRPFAA